MRLTIDFMRPATVAAGLFLAAAPALAQDTSSACLGQLMLFGGNYCPRGYTEADGKLLSISQNSALFSLYGTMYGGNGQTTFGIPDLRGRAPISLGQGPGLPNYSQGELTGSPTTTIQQPNLPATRPLVNALTGPSSSSGNPTGKLLGTAAQPTYASTGSATTMDPSMISPLGNGLPMTTQSPVQAIRWCVALQGIYCSRQ